VKPFGQEDDCLFVIQIKIVLLNLLLYEALGHQEGSAKLIGFDLFMINTSHSIRLAGTLDDDQ
jgi:hypothetical protein